MDDAVKILMGTSHKHGKVSCLEQVVGAARPSP